MPQSLANIIAYTRARNRPATNDAILVAHIDEQAAEIDRLRTGVLVLLDRGDLTHGDEAWLVGLLGGSIEPACTDVPITPSPPARQGLRGVEDDRRGGGAGNVHGLVGG
jgi:hypothetical protein